MASVLAAVEASVAAASHLTPLDAGAVENARALARLIDEAEARGLDEFARVCHNASPALGKILSDLGLTPFGRKGLPQPPASGGKLAQLRKAAETKT